MAKHRVIAASLFLALSAGANGAVTIKAIAANGNHSLVLDSDGTVWEWGAKSAVPVRVSGLTGVVSVAAGFDYGLAVRNDGTLWAWGANDAGQLGDGTTISPATQPGNEKHEASKTRRRSYETADFSNHIRCLSAGDFVGSQGAKL